MSKTWGTFGAAAGAAILGALMTLDWSQVVSQRTAGVVLIVLGGIAATIKAYVTPAPAPKSE